jgi:hypothetical protein
MSDEQQSPTASSHTTSQRAAAAQGSILVETATRVHYGDETSAGQEAHAISSSRTALSTSERPRIIRWKRPTPRPLETSSARFVVHELWEGVVEEVGSTYFAAQLVSRTLPDTFEQAEIYISEVSPADLPLVRAGAVFYWAIGYADGPTGQRTNSSSIRFRRLPQIHPDDVDDDPWLSSAEDAWRASS